MKSSPLILKRGAPDPEPAKNPDKPTGEAYGPHYESDARAVNMFRDFAAMFRSVGHSLYSDDLCGRLLAYCALSGSEDVVTNLALNGAIMVAQDTFNIKGGEVPDMAKLVYWRKAMQDLHDKGTKSEWWEKFAERYHIDKKRWPALDTAFKENFVYFKGPMTAKNVGRIREGDDTHESLVRSRMARLRE